MTPIDTVENLCIIKAVVKPPTGAANVRRFWHLTFAFLFVKLAAPTRQPA